MISALLLPAVLLFVSARFPSAEPAPAIEAASREALFDDWLHQDSGGDAGACFASKADSRVEVDLVRRVLAEVGDRGAELRRRLGQLTRANAPGSDLRWRALYGEACALRRAQRLARLLQTGPRIVFTKHHNLGGSHYAYTEGQSDAQAERHFRPGSAGRSPGHRQAPPCGRA